MSKRRESKHYSRSGSCTEQSSEVFPWCPKYEFSATIPAFYHNPGVNLKQNKLMFRALREGGIHRRFFAFCY